MSLTSAAESTVSIFLLLKSQPDAADVSINVAELPGQVVGNLSDSCPVCGLRLECALFEELV